MIRPPMKAKDLKAEIDWAWDDPYKLIADRYLTPAWACELKLDGVNFQMEIGADRNILAHGDHDRSASFPHLRNAAVRSLAGTVLDGELVAAGQGNMAQGLLTEAVGLFNMSARQAITRQARNGKAIFCAYDIQAVNGKPADRLPYVERRALLADVVQVMRDLHPGSKIQLVQQTPATRMQVQRAIDNGFEGVVLKDRDSLYYPGQRHGSWRKIKRWHTIDAVLTGDYRAGRNRHEGKVGSVAVGLRRGMDMVYIGSVGNLTDRDRDAMTTRTGGLDLSYQWRVVEVTAQGRSADGLLRHPHMTRWRPDKEWRDCQYEELSTFRLV